HSRALAALWVEPVISLRRAVSPAVVVLTVSAFAAALALPHATHARPPIRRPRRRNPIVVENARPGTRAWIGRDASSSTIEGYTSEASVLPGEAIDVHVSTQPAARYRIDVYRLGLVPRPRWATRCLCAELHG